MKDTTLQYVVFTEAQEKKTISLEFTSLYYIDHYTSKFKDEKEFIENYPNKDKIYDFISKNNPRSGRFSLLYTTNYNTREELPLVFGVSEDIVLKDDYNTNVVSEIERARKLILDSKSQLFIRLFLSNNSILPTIDYNLSISYLESLKLKKLGITILISEDEYYVNFYDILKYRANNKRLGFIRNLLEDLLDLWKEKIFDLPTESFYFYSRQMKLLIKHYIEICRQNISVKNVKLYKVADYDYSLNRKKTYYNFRKI